MRTNQESEKKCMCKKILAAGLALTMALSTAACASDSSDETAAPTTTQNGTMQSATNTTSVDVSQFQPTDLVDNEDMLFRISAIVKDPIWGYTLKVQIENRSDNDLMFSLNNVSVNGFMCDPYFAATVTAGMKANKEISFSTEAFDEIGIAEVTDIEFELRVYDSNNWAADDIFDEDFRIYPLGEAAAKEYHRESQQSDIVLFDNEQCTMIVTGFDPDSVWGYSANVYLVNKTDDDLMFSVGDAAVNGFMCNPNFAKTVAAGKQCVTSISWTSSSFEENDITDVESITLPIRVYDAQDWVGNDLINDTFTVNP